MNWTFKKTAKANQAEEFEKLYFRTLQTFALAIEAKDHTTYKHLERVQHYSLSIGKMLGLNETELSALRVAAVLHDVGKLAVPEHIISKLGKLTPEEFEKMKVHPVVGAEILERVQFPYPVAPIVRSHHEKWNGTGYPDGLKGDQIPIGARILSAVDSLDACASDRPYRRALPLDAAMEVIERESGKAFDPTVIALLKKHCRQLQAEVDSVQPPSQPKPSTDLQVERGAAPAASLDPSAASPVLVNGEITVGFLTSIGAARQELQALLQIVQDLGNSLSLVETLSLLGLRLRGIIPHDALAIWVVRQGSLIPEYVSGDDFRLFSSLEIPVGQGLSGWVAENRKCILNGNPSVEPGYLNDPGKFSTLRSALAVPLEGLNDIVGVLTLYRAETDGFTRDDLRMLLAIGAKIGISIENALEYARVADSESVTRLKRGVDEWNSWRVENSEAKIDLRRANLVGLALSSANLADVDLSSADLTEANLSFAQLARANLTSARLQSSNLDGAVLTDAKLWGTQRDGWSIKGITCERAFWDRKAVEATAYRRGEFEELYADLPRIELFYEGGVTSFELNTLPGLLHRLGALHPGCGIRLKSLEQASGGAKVTITVSEASASVVEEIRMQAKQAHAAQLALRDNLIAQLEIEKRLLLDEVMPRISRAALSSVPLQSSIHYTNHYHGDVLETTMDKTVNIKQVGTYVDGGTGHSVTTNQTVTNIAQTKTLIDEILKHRTELDLAPEQAKTLDTAIAAIGHQSANPKLLRESLSSIRHVLEHAGGALLAHEAPIWLPALIDQVTSLMSSV